MANNTWLRLYTEITRDRKLRRLPVSYRWIWITILCLAKESPKPGYLLLSENVPITIEDIADEADVEKNEVENALKAFKQQFMLYEENEILVVTNWNKRQFESDSSTERVRKHRQRKFETLQQRYSSNDETPPDTDTESDTDIINNSSNDEFAADAASEIFKLDTPSYQPSPEEEVMNHYNAKFKGVWQQPLKLTPDRRRKIKARLKTYSVADICQAIDNIRASPYHCGENPSKQVYATPEFICRNDGMIDKWLNMPVSQQKQEELDLVEAYYADRKRAAAKLGS